jgi:hypothetical protein
LTGPPPELPFRLGHRFWEHEMEKALFGIITRYRLYGSILDYSEKSLVTLESLLPRNAEDYEESVWNFKTFEYDGSYVSDWLVAFGPGAYFGEVIRRNLEGRWRYPSRLRIVFSFYRGYISPIFLNWFVIVANQRVPIFEIARRRLTKGAAEVTLTQIYGEIAGGTYGRKMR